MLLASAPGPSSQEMGKRKVTESARGEAEERAAI